MTFTITPNTPVASIAQHIIDNHSRQKSATLLADLYERQMTYMTQALQSKDSGEAIKFAENLADIVTIARGHDIHRDMHVARLRTMPYRG